MSFQNPWMLALIPVLLWLFRRKQTRTSVTVDAITEATNLEPGRARYLWLTGCLRKLSVLAVLIALAGPQVPASFDREVNEGIAIQLLVDVSSSMDMTTSSISGQKVSRIKLAKEIVEELEELNDKVALILNDQHKIKEISKEFSKLKHILFLGRDIMYPVAMEGALKMKEVCYIHAEAYPAGEMKHGVNALIGEKMPSLVMAPTGISFNKMLSTINEIKARDGEVIGLTDNDSNEFTSLLSNYLIIDSYNYNLDVILYSINLQLLSFYTSLLLKINPDRPRNLAKTVTVE